MQHIEGSSHAMQRAGNGCHACFRCSTIPGEKSSFCSISRLLGQVLLQYCALLLYLHCGRVKTTLAHIKILLEVLKKKWHLFITFTQHRVYCNVHSSMLIVVRTGMWENQQMSRFGNFISALTVEAIAHITGDIRCESLYKIHPKKQ